MSIDEEIERELAAQAYQLDKMMREEQGLVPLLQSGFRGGLQTFDDCGLWNALLFAVTIVYCAYQFFTVDVASQKFGVFVWCWPFRRKWAPKFGSGWKCSAHPHSES